MKNILTKKVAGLSLLLVFLFTASHGQLVITDTGDCNSHTLHATLTGTMPTGTGITADDAYSGVFPIGFTFNFYGTNYTQLVIGSNGVLNFNTALAGAYCPWPITAALLGNPDMRNAVCGPWCDILISAGGSITQSTSGVAPNRKFSVTWCGTRMFSCTTQWTTSQIILYETSNLIEVHTAHKTICAWNSGAAITGIQNAAGTLATVAPGRDWTPSWSVISPPEAWRFTPSGATYTVASIPYAPMPYATSGIYWYNALTGAYLGSGPFITVNPTVPTTYMAAALGCNDSTKAFYVINPNLCLNAEANSPCVGDTLWLNGKGDSTGATYQWSGPAPSTAVFATTQKTFIFPATAAHSGTYRVIKNVAGALDTSTVVVTIRHKPTVVASSNAPLCIGSGNTLLLSAVTDSPSVTYSWTAYPPSFTSGVQNPAISGFSAADTGTYRVIVTSVFGCKDTSSVHVTIVPAPAPPIVTALTPYCQGDAFVPFTIAGVVPGGTVLWYATATGGTGSVTSPAVNTAVPGLYTYYFSQIIGSCESPRDSVKVRVNPLPAPILGTTGVCQYLTTTLSSTSAGGVWSSGNPAVAAIDPVTGVVTGISGATSGTTATITYTLPTSCRATTVVTVYGKPVPPGIPEYRPCQYDIPAVLTVLPGSPLPGGSLQWYGLGVTTANAAAPMPRTDTAAGVYNYYVTQTTAFGCVSDSALYPVRIVAQPAEPEVRDTFYCQHYQFAAPLTAKGDSIRWYTSAIAPPAGSGSYTAPTPSTLLPGTTRFFVTQTKNTCESKRAYIDVEILYTPEFEILADRDWVCQYDSLRMKYDGPNPLVNMAFDWQLPIGASFVNGTKAGDSIVMVSFDTVWGQHDVFLTVTNYGGKCRGNDTQRIRVVPAPNTHPYMSPDMCLGDTLTLALSDRTPNAHTFTWMIDGQPMAISPALNIVSANSHSGGPYVISWQQTGRHTIGVQGLTAEGCRSVPTADTVNVHALPDPRFSLLLDSAVTDKNGKKLCVEDSVLFVANVKDYSWSYKWEPGHFFANENKPVIWGRVEQERSMIKLTVTDPFGCTASYEKKFMTDLCCVVSFPNAFTPNSDGRNDVFRPIFAGYRRFHTFRVSNRWGQTVFESANTNPSWDGTYNGVPQDMGTYFYFIKYDCGGKTLEAKGDITLIR